jgi:hypothetical protein
MGHLGESLQDKKCPKASNTDPFGILTTRNILGIIFNQVAYICQSEDITAGRLVLGWRLVSHLSSYGERTARSVSDGAVFQPDVTYRKRPVPCLELFRRRPAREGQEFRGFGGNALDLSSFPPPQGPHQPSPLSPLPRRPAGDPVMLPDADQITTATRELLTGVSLDGITVRIIRDRLEERFGQKLDSMKELITQKAIEISNELRQATQSAPVSSSKESADEDDDEGQLGRVPVVQVLRLELIRGSCHRGGRRGRYWRGK